MDTKKIAALIANTDISVTPHALERFKELLPEGASDTPDELAEGLISAWKTAQKLNAVEVWYEMLPSGETHTNFVIPLAGFSLVALAREDYRNGRAGKLCFVTVMESNTASKHRSSGRWTRTAERRAEVGHFVAPPRTEDRVVVTWEENGKLQAALLWASKAEDVINSLLLKNPEVEKTLELWAPKQFKLERVVKVRL